MKAVKEILMNRTIYLDNAATTQPFPEVLDAMLPYYGANYGNPSSAYELGEESKRAVEEARGIIADTLHAEPETIYFTSGGTESDNWALRYAASIAMADKSGEDVFKQEKYFIEKTYEYGTGKKEGVDGRYRYDTKREMSPHIITSSVEHHAILRACEALEKEGLRVAYLPVNSDGIVDLSLLEQWIGSSTVLVSVMFANNEIGTLQPVRQAAEIAHRHGALFHTDAVQAYGQVPIDPQQLGIDLLSASGHKLNGPKGIGFLYAGKGLEISSMIRGGMQEKGKRAGTENVPGIVGLGCAARMSHQMMKQKVYRETSLRNYFIRRLLTEIRDVKINGSMQMRLPNNINCCIRGVDGSALVALLDLEGICISAASACQTGSGESSHVQLAIGNTSAEARSAIRITLGPQTTRDELDITVDTLKQIVARLRDTEIE